MNSYKYTRQSSSFPRQTRAAQRLTLIIIVALATALIIVGMLFARSSAFESAAKRQIIKRIYSSVIDANDQVSRLTGGVQSNSAQKAGLIRQYIYTIDQLNSLSISVSGERGRIVPQDALSVLYDDIDSYEKLIQAGTANTLEVRDMMTRHLQALQVYLKPQ